MNNIHIVDGRIGAKGAEVLSTRGGKPFIKFSLANNSFIGGQEKTTWYDVVCYDPFIIDNKTEKLKKGTPVMVHGTLFTDSNVKENKVWLNHNLTAYRIDIMALGNGENSGTTETVKEQPSVYTGGTPSEAVATQAPVQEKPAEEYSTGNFEGSGGDDDLPF